MTHDDELNNNSPNDFDEQTKDSALSANSKLKGNKIYFWEKWAYKPEDEEYDKLNFYEIEDEDLSIREVIRGFLKTGFQQAPFLISRIST